MPRAIANKALSFRQSDRSCTQVPSALRAWARQRYRRARGLPERLGVVGEWLGSQAAQRAHKFHVCSTSGCKKERVAGLHLIGSCRRHIGRFSGQLAPDAEFEEDKDETQCGNARGDKHDRLAGARGPKQPTERTQEPFALRHDGVHSAPHRRDNGGRQRLDAQNSMRQARDGMRARGFRRAPPGRRCDAKSGLSAEPLSCLCPTVDLLTLPCASASEQRSDVDDFYGSSLNKLFRYFRALLGHCFGTTIRASDHAFASQDFQPVVPSSVGENGGDALPQQGQRDHQHQEIGDLVEQLGRRPARRGPKKLLAMAKGSSTAEVASVCVENWPSANRARASSRSPARRR